MPITFDKLKELRQRRGEVIEQGAQILTDIEAARAKKDATREAELMESFRKIHEDDEALKRDISLHEAQWDAEQELREGEMRDRERAIAVERGKEPAPLKAARQDTEGVEPADPEEGSRAAAHAAAFSTYLRGGFEDCTPEQRAILRAGRAELKAEEIRGLPAEVRTAQSGGSGALGGYLVPEAPMQPIVDARLQFGGMRRARTTKITTAGGNEIPIPTNNDTGNKGRRIGSNKAAVNTNVTVGQVRIGAYIYTSDYFLVPFDLLQDVGFTGFESWLMSKLGERNERILNEELTVYDGSDGPGPEGIVTGVSVGKQGATGQTTTLIDTDLDALEHSVDPAYRLGAEYMMSDNSLLQIKTLKNGIGERIFRPGLTGSDPDRINNYTYIINQDMPDMAASVKSIIFGDLSSYWIRDVSGVMILRLTERFAEAGQVAFLLFSRHDGKYVDAGTNPIKAYQNSAT